ncbi:hypothetical protein BDY24DRAFT_442659 [Mrakia frigida]|uniref:uncharacterized protein n=1 Tax=Mrakia frigida TaxID=29902 RepID=UPI003FCC091B
MNNSPNVPVSWINKIAVPHPEMVYRPAGAEESSVVVGSNLFCTLPRELLDLILEAGVVDRNHDIWNFLRVCRLFKTVAEHALRKYGPLLFRLDFSTEEPSTEFANFFSTTRLVEDRQVGPQVGTDSKHLEATPYLLNCFQNLYFLALDYALASYALFNLLDSHPNLTFLHLGNFDGQPNPLLVDDPLLPSANPRTAGRLSIRIQGGFNPLAASDALESFSILLDLVALFDWDVQGIQLDGDPNSSSFLRLDHPDFIRNLRSSVDFSGLAACWIRRFGAREEGLWLEVTPSCSMLEDPLFELTEDVHIPTWKEEDGREAEGLSKEMMKSWEGVQLTRIRVHYWHAFARAHRSLVVGALEFAAKPNMLLQPRHIESLSNESGLVETTSLNMTGFLFGDWENTPRPSHRIRRIPTALFLVGQPLSSGSSSLVRRFTSIASSHSHSSSLFPSGFQYHTFTFLLLSPTTSTYPPSLTHHAFYRYPLFSLLSPRALRPSYSTSKAPAASEP